MARLVAVLLALLLVLSACGDGGGSPPGPPTLHRAFRCPDPQVEEPRDRGADRLPSGATEALLCYRAVDAEWTAPSGPLTMRLDDLVGLVNSQRTVHDDTCSLVGGPAWSMVFRYHDGTRTIDGDNGGCGTMFVGSSERSGARRAFLAFLGALLAQRRASPPPGSAVRSPACPHGQYVFPSFVAQQDRVAAATWCLRQDRRWTPVGDAGAAQLQLLRHEFAHEPPGSGAFVTTRRCHGLPRTTYGVLVGRDPWGEAFSSILVCDYYQFVVPGEQRSVFYRMSPAMRGLVSRVLADTALRP
jgi:hypothetical protein